jgi:dipeptidyl aminopeptidase/acylaminoacyl peptidase
MTSCNLRLSAELHKRRRLFWKAAVLLIIPAMTDAASQAEQFDPVHYERAAAFRLQNIVPLVLNARVQPRWRTGERERFTYRRELSDRRSEFVEVDAATAKRKPAFDHVRIADGLSRATGTAVDAARLPFYDFDEVSGAIRFDYGASVWECSRTSPSCRNTGIAARDLSAIASPDGRWRAYVDGGNLWIRSADGAERFALTQDGAPRYGYAGEAEVIVAENVFGPFRTPKGEGTSRTGPPVPPATPPSVLWSPDSKRLITHRLDERKVRDVSITQYAPTDGTVGPITWTFKKAFVNDLVLPQVEHWIFDIDTREGRKVMMDPVAVLYTTPVTSEHAMWSPDSKVIRMITRDQFHKTMTLHLIDADSGRVRPLISETSNTTLEPGLILDSAQARYLVNGDVIWYSERSGNAHLYLYDGQSGALRRSLTSGDWIVRNLLHVDESNGLIYVAGLARTPTDDPYYRKIYSVRLKDGRVSLLTPEDADHLVTSVQQGSRFYRPPATDADTQEKIGFSPSGRYFVESMSRVDLATTTVLRAADGRLIAEIEKADFSALAKLGWLPPERFNALGADGHTMIYGTIWRPSGFDPSKKYPVLESIYQGVQLPRTWPTFVDNVLDPYEAQAFAQLGIVVVAIDGRGTAFRSKAFRDFAYGRFGDAELLADHVAALQGLATQYSYMDLSRVGLLAISGAGFSAVDGLLHYPDFYKVGISDGGIHDPRTYAVGWAHSELGPDSGANYDRASNHLRVKGIQGKLLVTQGDMNTNVMPHQSMKLVEALLKESADFEMMVVPNMGNIMMSYSGNHLRRTWDFIVRNLIDAEPPPVQSADLH